MGGDGGLTVAVELVLFFWIWVWVLREGLVESKPHCTFYIYQIGFDFLMALVQMVGVVIFFFFSFI